MYSLSDFDISPTTRELIERAIANGDNILISGRTGSGKSSLSTAVQALRPLSDLGEIRAIEDAQQFLNDALTASGRIAKIHAADAKSAFIRLAITAGQANGGDEAEASVEQLRRSLMHGDHKSVLALHVERESNARRVSAFELLLDQAA